MGMLALTRRKGQEVYIGDPAEPLGIVRVVDIQGDKVKLAFQFPRELAVNRRELAEEKARDAREKAAKKSGTSGGSADPSSSDPSKSSSKESTSPADTSSGPVEGTQHQTPDKPDGSPNDPS